VEQNDATGRQGELIAIPQDLNVTFNDAQSMVVAVAALVLGLVGTALGLRRPKQARYRNRWVRALRAADGQAVWFEKRAITRVTVSKQRGGLIIRVLGQENGTRVRDEARVRKALGIRQAKGVAK
jgi:hypothetical protein